MEMSVTESQPALPQSMTNSYLTQSRNVPPCFDNDYPNQVGSLGHLRRTRQDLCCSRSLDISLMFTKLGSHGSQNYLGLHNTMLYIKPTKHHELFYTSNFKNFQCPWDMKTNVNSDWVTWKVSRRSRTDYLVKLNRHLITFGSKLQTAVVKSFTDAEHMVSTHVIKLLLLWIVNMMHSVSRASQIKSCLWKPIPTHVNDKSCVNLTNAVITSCQSSPVTSGLIITFYIVTVAKASDNNSSRSESTRKPKRLMILLATGESFSLAPCVTFHNSVVSDHRC